MYKRNRVEPSLIFSKSAFFFASFHPSFSRHIKKEGKQKNIKNHLIAVQIIIKVSQETIHWIELKNEKKYGYLKCIFSSYFIIILLMGPKLKNFF